MLVYGDAQLRQPLHRLTTSLREKIADANPESLDDVRELLIFAGQIEQAVEDSEISADARNQFVQLTDDIAKIFYELYAHGGVTQLPVIAEVSGRGNPWLTLKL